MTGFACVRYTFGSVRTYVLWTMHNDIFSRRDRHDERISQVEPHNMRITRLCAPVRFVSGCIMRTFFSNATVVSGPRFIIDRILAEVPRFFRAFPDAL